MTANMKSNPRRPARNRPTTLSLTDEAWSGLKQIERETGAKPSAIVRRLIEAAVAKRPKGEKP